MWSLSDTKRKSTSDEVDAVFYAPLLILSRVTTLTRASFDTRALRLSKALPRALPPIPIGAGHTHKSLVSIVLDCDCP
jgi:hypothetical protein